VNILRFEVGIVSAEGDALADFYAEVFDVERLENMPSSVGSLHRLQFPDVVLKIMVPKREPAALPETPSFLALSGLRYLTIGVDDFEGTLARATDRGARIQHGPMELAPGVHLAILEDPEGNAIELVGQPPA
jgi:catechol 2,3-dioxygenase-like lactoylglutathione lyase family enzyme